MLFHKIVHELIRPAKDLNRLALKLKEQVLSKIYAEGIFVDAKVYRGWCGKIISQNWGDDLNAHFLEKLFQKRMCFSPPPKKACAPRYQFIGSIVGPHYGESVRIVWGSGLLRELPVPEDMGNQKFLAVRGPLTRASLLRCGVDCPEVYGDPALLLPRFLDYTPPPPQNRRGIGVISAWWEHKNPQFFKFLKNFGNTARRIKTRDYKDWKDFIREICSCEFVISSSLHGIIVAEAYGIPSLWVIFSKKQQNEGHYFKYRDFYFSIGKNISEPLMVTESTTEEELRRKIVSWKPGKIETDALLAACPFTIAPSGKANLNEN